MSPKLPTRLLAVQSDGRLLDLAGQGHERAFEALVCRYRGALLRYCRRLGLSESRAEDVLQLSLMKAWLALTGGSEVRELRPWLYRIVHNVAVSTVHRARVEHLELSDAVEASTGLHQESELEVGLAAREALSHVAELPEMQRHAIVLTAIEGRSHEETASALGISDGAVRGLLYRARSTLRSAAAVVSPAGWLDWIARAASGLSPAERSSELVLGGGAAGAAGLLAKSAAVVGTASLLAAGATIVHLERPQVGNQRTVRPATSQVAQAPAAGSSVRFIAAVRRGAHAVPTDTESSRRGRHDRGAGDQSHRSGHGSGRSRGGSVPSQGSSPSDGQDVSSEVPATDFDSAREGHGGSGARGSDERSSETHQDGRGRGSGSSQREEPRYTPVSSSTADGPGSGGSEAGGDHSGGGGPGPSEDSDEGSTEVALADGDRSEEDAEHQRGGGEGSSEGPRGERAQASLERG